MSSVGRRPTSNAVARMRSAMRPRLGTRAHKRMVCCTRPARGALRSVQVTHRKFCSGRGTCKDMNGSKVVLMCPHFSHRTTERSCPENNADTTERSREQCAAQRSRATSSSGLPSPSFTSGCVTSLARFTSSLKPLKKTARNSCTSCCTQPAKSCTRSVKTRTKVRGAMTEVFRSFALAVASRSSENATARCPPKPDTLLWLRS
mmetsp:Transcript_66908/g.193363  ORF Transcript_66908/g.193363 Transcript_66908/m.193363 type:complete len:204 (+) Transcript_66908:46-657(+)